MIVFHITDYDALQSVNGCNAFYAGNKFCESMHVLGGNVNST